MLNHYEYQPKDHKHKITTLQKHILTFLTDLQVIPGWRDMIKMLKHFMDYGKLTKSDIGLIMELCIVYWTYYTIKPGKLRYLWN